MKELDISPISRIEGHLDFKIMIEDHKVVDAKAIGARSEEHTSELQSH